MKRTVFYHITICLVVLIISILFTPQACASLTYTHTKEFGETYYSWNVFWFHEIPENVRNGAVSATITMRVKVWDWGGAYDGLHLYCGPTNSITANSESKINSLTVSTHPSSSNFYMVTWSLKDNQMVWLKNDDDEKFYFVLVLPVGMLTSAVYMDYCTLEVTYINGNGLIPPVADAGDSYSPVNEGASVTLDGSGSYDPDGVIESYSWTQTDGPAVTLSDPNAMQPTFTAPDVGVDGESLTFQLTVTDNGGLQDTDTCIVNISCVWENNPPTAIAKGPDTKVNEGDTVTLDGFDSNDPDEYEGDGIAAYRWEQEDGTSVTLSDPTAPKPTFVTPPINPDETMYLTFKLTVEDKGGLQDNAYVTITIHDNGITGFPIDVVTMTCATGKNIGFKAESGGSCTSMNVIDPTTITDTQNRPGNMIYGLMDMRIKVNKVGGSVEITIHLPNPAPEGYKWYKYSEDRGWYPYSDDYFIFNETRDAVTITLVDGDIGDDDGEENGKIEDPSGLGLMQDQDSAQDSDEDNGGICFITGIRAGDNLISAFLD